MAVSSPIIVILGPTASGKTALALAVAERVGAEILSVDSMQVYRHMDVGTAKPTADERVCVPHHMIDLVEPDQAFAVSEFVEQADAVIHRAAGRGVPIIATGGTPMYYKSLFEGLFDGPGADDAIRARLNAEPLELLHPRLPQIDPPSAMRIHVNDRRRLVRALEVYDLTGRTISSMQNEWSSGKHRHEAVWFGLNWEKEELNRRINARVKLMMQTGWLEETRSVLDRFGALSKTAAEATGYHELLEHLHGRMSLDDAVEQIKIATRQLARRQMKWFRRFSQVTWLNGADDVQKNADAIVQASVLTTTKS
ncbi:MAG: tRNA (adenosine(37)-N6)-dimethylallyltransferase MiaA [Burkholderiales bacterium]|nr:tRNA (adenosine(37)-N6)-dimethylallyltransferase MiaA [Phycisphaerae bacterium]